MSDLPRRNGWTLAERAGDAPPGRMQRLLNRACWDAPAAIGVVRAFAVAGLAPPIGFAVGTPPRTVGLASLCTAWASYEVSRSYLLGRERVPRMGVLGRLFGRSGRRPLSGGVCDVCNADFDPVAGYYVRNRDVALAERYWEHAFSGTKRSADLFGLTESQESVLFAELVKRRANDRSAWAVCESCSEYFIFDRDEARAHAVGGTQPAGSRRRIDPAGFVLFAALGWQRVYGHWPAANVAPVNVVATCDQCEKSIYVGEYTGFVPSERMAQIRAEGLVDTDPVRAPRQREDGEGFVMCQPCMARFYARAYRAEHSQSNQ